MNVLLRKCVDDLTETIRTSEIYTRYAKAEEVLSRDAELKKQVDLYRQEVFILQNAVVGDMDPFEANERLFRKYAALRSNPIVNEYLEAELDLCRLIQMIHQEISSAFPFSTPWEEPDET